MYFELCERPNTVRSSVPDPWHFGMDPDPGPRIHASDWRIWIRIRILLFSSLTFKTPTITNVFEKVFLLITFWRYIYIIFQRLKVLKTAQNSRNQGFSYFFCLITEESGSGSIPQTSGSGSERLSKVTLIKKRKRNFPHIWVNSDGREVAKLYLYEERLPNIWGNAKIFNHIWGDRLSIWLCNRSLLNFSNSRKIQFSFLSVKASRNLPDVPTCLELAHLWMSAFNAFILFGKPCYKCGPYGT